jgi:hypothetical protein
MKIIWLSGWAGSGKDTMAEILCKKLDYHRFAFADSLKDIVAQENNFPRSWCDTQEGKKIVINADGQTVRDMLIQKSFEMKKLNQNIFTEKEYLKIVEGQAECNNIVITDWRYKHEYSYFKALFPLAQHTTVRIIRPAIESADDPSEHELDDWSFDFRIINDISPALVGNRLIEIINM